MKPDKEIKKEFKLEASKDPDKFYPAKEVLLLQHLLLDSKPRPEGLRQS
jgi:hypothetical protein